MRASKSVTKPAQTKRTPDDPEQSKRFLEAAKAAGANETDKAAADKAFKAVVKPRKGSKK